MAMTVRSKVVKIGNSRGIRIPRSILEQAGLSDEVELIVENNKLIIRPANQPRQGWEAQFASVAEHGDERLFEGYIPTQWDEDEWEW